MDLTELIRGPFSEQVAEGRIPYSLLSRASAASRATREAHTQALLDARVRMAKEREVVRRYDASWSIMLGYMLNQSERSMHWPEEEERRNDALKAEFRAVCLAALLLVYRPLYC